jgi:RND family efflux transporter MFP subunit
LGVQQGSLRLVAPVDGLVVAREADPGTTVVAGQAVVEIIDPSSLWMNVRFDQISAAGLRRDLPAQIVLSSRSGQPLKGHVLRVEPKADAVTEETLAKVIFDTQPESLPPLGELAEVTVNLPALPAAPTVANAALRRLGEQIGVWKLVDDDLQFVPVKLGESDLNGRVQVREGVAVGDQVVTYSEKTLTAKSRIKVVDHIAGAPR